MKDRRTTTLRARWSFQEGHLLVSATMDASTGEGTRSNDNSSRVPSASRRTRAASSTMLRFEPFRTCSSHPLEIIDEPWRYRCISPSVSV